MFRIIIEDDDLLYRHGMELLLKEIFQAEMGKNIEISDLSYKNISTADLIVKKFIAGERFICQPLLRKRSRNSVFIGIYENNTNLNISQLPLCVENVIFINRREPYQEIKNIIINEWKVERSSKKYVQLSCLRCKYGSLTPKEKIMASCFYRQQTPGQIAVEMKINVKTVCAHKRLMMRKFDLSSDQELFNFIKKFGRKYFIASG